MKIHTLTSFLLATTLLFPSLGHAMNGGTTPLTVERLYDSPALAGESLRNVKLSPDGQRVTYLAGRKDNQHFYDLWEMHPSTGNTKRLLNADKLESGNLSDEEKARRERQRIYGQGIMEYFWSNDGKALLIPASGKLYYYRLADEKVTQLQTGDLFATDAKLSPDGKLVSFVAQQNLYTYTLATNKLTQLTTTGGEAIKNGMAEFVAQEEMDRMTGYWWSPDSQAIAFTQVDESKVELITRNEIYADGIKLTQQRYPAAGKTNVAIALGVISLNNNQIQWVDLGENKDIYLPRVKWLPNSTQLSFEWQSRDQQQLDLRVADLAKNAAPRILISEHSEAWINLNDDLHFLKTQSDFIWTSERSGYNHIYLFDKNGQVKRQLTQGDWAVDEIAYIDEAKKWVYFTGRKDNVTEKQLYKVSFDGKQIIKLSREWGTHNPVFAKNKPIYLDYFSSLSQPPQVSLHDETGNRLTWIKQNKIDKDHPLYAYAGLWQQPQFGTLKASDGQTLHYRLFKPANFDESNQYPVVVRVYGGPHAQLVVNSWSSQDYYTQYLLQQGFAVFQLDNRGSAHRGTKFEQVIYKQLGKHEVEDQKVGVDYLRSLPWVSADNIAIYGHSYGGYMALMSLFKAPDYFKAAISGAPVTDWQLYDTHYTERYLGHPQQNAAGYEQSSVFPYIKNYQSGLLMYHGMADDNVLFENSTRVYKALQDDGKLFEMINYPGSKHSMRGNKVKTHLYRSLTQFLNQELKE